MSILQRSAHEMAGLTMGGAWGAGIGSVLLGPVGGYLSAARWARRWGKAVQAAREAGIQTMTIALGNQHRRVSLVSAAQTGSGQDQQQRQALPAFALRHNDLSALAPHSASYGGAARQ